MQAWEYIKQYKKQIIIVTIITLLLFLILFFLPFKYTVNVTNEHNEPLNATIKLYWHNYNIWTTYGDTKSFYLPSSEYQPAFH